MNDRKIQTAEPLADLQLKKTDAPLIEGEDYVLEGGLFVLTREYLLKRGHCCGSGCRHCPYTAPADTK